MNPNAQPSGLFPCQPTSLFPAPVSHEFYEEVYYIRGEMLNTKTKRKIKGGTYVFHKPGEEHGPFRCLKTCLILEFRYYK